jgi:hypothetical protein
MNFGICYDDRAETHCNANPAIPGNQPTGQMYGGYYVGLPAGQHDNWTHHYTMARSTAIRASRPTSAWGAARCRGTCGGGTGLLHLVDVGDGHQVEHRTDLAGPHSSSSV